MVKSPTGFPMQSPYVAIANRQAEIMMRIAPEFGFTPAREVELRRHRMQSRRCSTRWPFAGRTCQLMVECGIVYH